MNCCGKIQKTTYLQIKQIVSKKGVNNATTFEILTYVDGVLINRTNDDEFSHLGLQGWNGIFY